MITKYREYKLCVAHSLMEQLNCGGTHPKQRGRYPTRFGFCSAEVQSFCFEEDITQIKVQCYKINVLYTICESVFNLTPEIGGWSLILTYYSNSNLTSA